MARYDRQARYAPLGSAGQERICAGRVAIIGVGALGSVICELLARAGVGYLRLIDRDVVELTNLQRQSLFTECDAEGAIAKVQAAAHHISEINREICVDPHAIDVTPKNILSLLQDVDLIVDGTDNFSTRFLINDAAWELGLPWIHGGCIGASGQAFAFIPGQTICLRCLMPTVPPAATVQTCDMAGVLGPATHLIASLQACSVLKILGQSPENSEVDTQVHAVDLWKGKFRSFDTSQLRAPNCPCCGLGQRDFLLGDLGAAEPQILCGRNAVQIPAPASGQRLDLATVATRWQGLGEIRLSRFLVRLQFDSDKAISLFTDGRAVIEGTENPAEANAYFSKYAGN
jgi:adenylyltransferase/sulfurtransferase